jgi:hypothetical protein
MSSLGAALGAAVPVSHARAEASRRNGAKSRGPRTPDGKARAAGNALKHGLRAATHILLPGEDVAAFRALEAALVEELAPVGAVQAALAGRIAIATWRLGRADRLEVEVLAFRAYAGASPGLALIRDGNGTRTIETLLRYRGAALAELTRCLRTLQTLQAQARAAAQAEAPPERAAGARTPATRPAARSAIADRPRPNEPEPRAAPRLDYAMPDRPAPAPTLHEPAAPWTPNEPEPCRNPGPARSWQEVGTRRSSPR